MNEWIPLVAFLGNEREREVWSSGVHAGRVGWRTVENQQLKLWQAKPLGGQDLLHLLHCLSLFKGPMARHQGCVCVIGRYRPFWKSAPCDITGGRVHRDVWRTGERRLLRSHRVLAGGLIPSSTHLGGHAHFLPPLWRHKGGGRFPTRLVTANHTTPGATSWDLQGIAFFFFFFVVEFISGPHCVALLWGHDAYVAAAPIVIRLKPRPHP